MSDYIKREDAMKTLADEYDECEFKRYAEGLFKDIPAEDVAPVRHAFWKSTGADEWGQCSYCGVPDKKKGAVYCRHCGAIMDGGELNDNNELHEL